MADILLYLHPMQTLCCVTITRAQMSQAFFWTPVSVKCFCEVFWRCYINAHLHQLKSVVALVKPSTDSRPLYSWQCIWGASLVKTSIRLTSQLVIRLTSWWHSKIYFRVPSIEAYCTITLILQKLFGVDYTALLYWIIMVMIIKCLVSDPSQKCV